MSDRRVCDCLECEEPLPSSRQRIREPRLWRIITKRSKYEAGTLIKSESSTVSCLRCGAVWRTKREYVDSLKMLGKNENYYWLSKVYFEEMRRLGREPVYACDI